MKSIVFLLFLAFFFQIQSQNKKQIKLELIDGYTNQVIKDQKVFVSKNEDEKTIEYTIDENGILIIEYAKKKNIELSITPIGNKYLSRYVFYRPKKQSGDLITLYLYPTERYEKEMISLEDSIYGPDTLSSENYKEPENLAVYRGGMSEMMRFIMQNLEYPAISKEMGEQGKCYLSFIVEKTGAISHVKVIKGISKELDQEAKRVLRSMPKWKPASIGNENIRLKFVLPINFRLS